jgi:hypothetical protein
VFLIPKAKPTQVIVHRIELQETERATLEAALAGRFVTNGVSAAGSVLTGMGNFLAPFSGAITAIAALWIAGRSWDEIMGAAGGAGSELKEYTESELTASGIPYYTAFTSWLNSLNQFTGQAGICAAFDAGEIPQGANGIAVIPVPAFSMDVPGFFVKRMHQFLTMYCAASADDTRLNDPVGWWMEFYPATNYGSEYYYWTQYTFTRTQTTGWFMRLFGGWA